jgi:hypothetical protein
MVDPRGGLHMLPARLQRAHGLPACSAPKPATMSLERFSAQ